MANLYTKSYNLTGSSDLDNNYSILKILVGLNGVQYTFGNSEKGIVLSGLGNEAEQANPNAIEFGLENKRLFFSKAILDPQGNFVILGYYQSEGHSIIPYLFVFNFESDLLHHKEIKINYIRNIQSLLLLNNEEIFISLGFIESPTNKKDTVCCIKLNLDFSITNSIKISRIWDDQYRGAILYQKSILLYGSAAAGPNKGLITLLSSEFKKTKTFTIKGLNIVPRIDNILVEKERGLILFGNYIKNKKAYLTILACNRTPKELKVSQTKVFDLGLGDVTVTKAVKYQNHYVCIAHGSKSKKQNILVFDSKFNIIKNQSFDLKNYTLYGLDKNNDYLQIHGGITEDKKDTKGLVIQTDASFQSCKVVDNDANESWIEDVAFETVNLKLNKLEVILNNVEFLVNTELKVTAISICEDSDPNDDPNDNPNGDPNDNPKEIPYKKVPFNFGDNYKLQSPYLSLQSAGSKGIDSSYGNHLRWFLTGNLGDNHLPKGNYATNNLCFNKKDDFVKVYRVPYNAERSLNNGINIFNEFPHTINDDDFIWVYKWREKTYYLEFENNTKYTAIRNSIGAINNLKKAQELLTAYGLNTFKFSCKDELSFAINILKDANSTLRLETFSVENRSYAEDDPIISTRKTYNSTTTLCRIIAENVSFIRFSVQLNSSISIVLESYSDILRTRKNQAEFIGNFALEKNQSKVFKRLEDLSKYKIDALWHKFDSNQVIKAQNYKDRWKDTDFGLGKGVDKFITLSETDPKAIFEHQQSEGSFSNEKDESKMEVSYLDFIQLASLDYHNARMLGLGFIDNFVNESEQFIYFAEYETIKNPEDYNEEYYTKHIYFSLPTGVEDERLPQKLKMLPITYGLKIDNATSEPLSITDEEGYAFKMNTRYVNLKAQLETDYSLSNSFFNPNIEFESSEFSNPIFLGFKNKQDDAPSWNKPDLLHEEAFLESSDSYKENALALFNKESDKPNYIHAIESEGFNHYNSYPVNIFYRTSVLSNEVSTNETKFNVENTLMPPSNINVHLIQEEGLPMLTTKDEQDWLKGINGDKTLVRLIFDYNHVQEKNYSWGNKIRIFHSKKFPDNIIGGVKNVYDDTDSKFCFIETKDFDYHSTGEILIPKINLDDYPNYVGSLFSYSSEQYEIVEILTVNTDGTYPTIKVKKNEQRVANLNSSNNNYQLTQGYKGPEISEHDAFLIVENFSNSISWKDKVTPNDNQLSFEIELINNDFSVKTETYLDENGQNPNDIKVRGLWDDCNISHHTMIEYMVDKDNNRVKDKANNDVIKEFAYYKIEFNNIVLDHHPQFISPDNNSNTSSVDWFKGTIRVHAINDSTGTKARKVLKIDEIQNVGTIPPQKLILIASDLSYSNQVNKINSYDSINYQDKRIQIANIAPEIKIGSNVSVNYYPSYKVYLRSDNAALFNETTILPEIGKGEQKTLIGLQTIDYDVLDNNSIPYSSPVGVPAIIFGNEIIKLEQPDPPTGPLFATPPNFYGKAQYSFKTKFKAKPWGVVFFRTDINRILSILYSNKTLKEDILPRILPITGDDHFQDRWKGLLALECNKLEQLDCDSTSDFKEFPDLYGNPFAFPNPDGDIVINGDNENPGLTPWSDEWKKRMRYLISTCMLPLTEHPIITEFINDGAYIPLPKKQNLRDKNGKILHPSSDEFDMAPMAKIISDKEILFTDFTLDGNMNKNTAYVYTVREMNKALKFGKASDFLGPVQLINTTPPNPLVIKNLTVKLPTYENDFKSSVLFEINKIVESQNINKIQIYRLNNSAVALNPRDIEPVKEIELSSIDTLKPFYIEDDFSDLDQIPYGEPIYYNLITVRKIEYKDHNGNNKIEFVKSKSSKTIVTNIIDTNPPSKPYLDPAKQTFTSLNNIELSWDKCCYKGKYFVYILNEFNNWELIQTIESNDSIITYNYINSLEELDEDDNIIYYKFKIEVENTIGLINESDIFSIL
ncbi:hypothetical protein LPB136_13430 [Tenacibaculum todarodis]|uniref:Uncharacterized protein n=1 Tax=Tenacibaculum todarodis TaxID=1850252 RepID=A0A1L3JMJ6_9FLAO|nr:hypothetical protein [Tenacibaculum todarodis]APG66312.1 hypothetical protein LPB136_13430 [Tenacibaculum todarodis]